MTLVNASAPYNTNNIHILTSFDTFLSEMFGYDISYTIKIFENLNYSAINASYSARVISYVTDNLDEKLSP